VAGVKEACCIGKILLNPHETALAKRGSPYAFQPLASTLDRLIFTRLIKALSDSCGQGKMAMREQFTDGLKEAMKAGDKRRVSTIRLITSALKDRDIEQRGLGKPPLTDDEILGLLQKMVKQRQESLAIYKEAGRNDLAEQESEEIQILMGFMPAQLDAAAVTAAIAGAIEALGAASVKDMGKVMAHLKERYAGQMDFAQASARVKTMLSGA
jgi:uncharacterized protein YqeY